jgi:hypothetical protein
MASKRSVHACRAATVFFVATLAFCAGQAVYFSFVHRRGDRVFEHDFGTVFSGETREYVFRARNNIGKPVVVSGVVSECGCTAVDGELEGTTIDAGSAIEVPLRWTAPSTKGKFNKRVFVHFTDRSRPPLKLRIRASVRPRISCSPDHVDIDAASTYDAQARTVTVSLVSGAPPFELARVSTDTSLLSAAWEPVGKSGDRPRWRVTIKTVPPLREGRIEGNVFLHASDPTLEPVPLIARLSVRPAVVAAP